MKCGMDREEILSHVARMVEEAEIFASALSTDRQISLDYYNNQTPDLIAKKGQSQQVSGEVRKHYGRLKPAIERTFFGGGGIAEYEPLHRDQEQMARDATQYVNRVVLPECDGKEEIMSAIFDATILRTGILRWGVMGEREIERHEFFHARAEEIEQAGEIENLQEHEDGTFSGTVKTVRNRRKPFIRAVRRASFIIHPHSDKIRDNKCVGELEYWTRSDLILMGADRAIVDDLMAVETRHDSDVVARDVYSPVDVQDDFGTASVEHSAMDEVLVKNLYVRLDLDDDGVAELYNMMLAEGGDGIAEEYAGSGYVLLHMEEVDETPFAKIVIEHRPFTFDGHSLADDLLSIQKVKTQLLRDTLDNTYRVGNPRSFFKADGVENEEDLISGDSAVPIFIKGAEHGVPARDMMHTQVIPSIAGDTLPILHYMDSEGLARTGVNDLSGGVDPETFQDMSATGASIVSAAGQERAEMYIRTLAQGGLKDALGGLLKMAVQYADGPRERRVSGQWMTYDPGTWDWRMNAAVNVGLATGSRATDLQSMILISQKQDAIVNRYGPFNPLVTPVEIANVDRKIVELTGVEDASRYIRTPTDDELMGFAEQLSQQMEQDPEQGKHDTQAQLKQAEFEFKAQMAQFDRETALLLEQKKAERQANTELAQLEADTQVQITEAEIKATEQARADERTRREDEWRQHIEALRLSLQDDHHDDETALRREEMALKYGGAQ